MSRFGDALLGSAKEALAIAKGELAPARTFSPSPVDVRALRRKLGLTQAGFAGRYGFSVGAVRDWEQGRSAPEGATRSLLIVIEREPAAVDRALQGA